MKTTCLNFAAVAFHGGMYLKPVIFFFFFYTQTFFSSCLLLPHTFAFQLLNKPLSQVSSLLPPRFLPSIFIAHRVQKSDCSSIFHRVLLTHALALSASRFMHKKSSLQFYTSMHSGGHELTKPTYTSLEYNLIRHRGDRLHIHCRRQRKLNTSKRSPPTHRQFPKCFQISSNYS